MPVSVPVRTSAIEGVKLLELVPNEDGRGCLTEFHRDQWLAGQDPVQFNLVRSRARVMRGIHVHVRHVDWLMVVDGAMEACLGDLRDASPTRGVWEVATLDAGTPSVLVIPPGVAHGFYSPGASTHVYGMSEYWCPEEEMGCHWADPSLELPWSVPDDCIVSERDAGLGSLEELVERLAPYQGLFVDPGFRLQPSTL